MGSSWCPPSNLFDYSFSHIPPAYFTIGSNSDDEAEGLRRADSGYDSSGSPQYDTSSNGIPINPGLVRTRPSNNGVSVSSEASYLTTLCASPPDWSDQSTFGAHHHVSRTAHESQSRKRQCSNLAKGAIHRSMRE